MARSPATEHVAAEDPGADVVERLLRERVVDAGLAALDAVHPPPVARRDARHALTAARGASGQLGAATAFLRSMMPAA